MLLFRSSKTGKKPSGILSHFGSLLAAAQRMESMFATYERRSYDGQGDHFVVIDYDGRPSRIETFEETLLQFSAWMSKSRISEIDVDIKKSLRLKDLWMDDPIGSGGPRIVLDNPTLTEQHRNQLADIFYPFTDVVYPQDVYQAYSEQQFRGLLNGLSGNKHFQDELRKRKERSLSIGEDFRRAAVQEIVWIDLTLKLRKWALENNFDSFVYENAEEDVGSDAYVTLHPSQIKKIEGTFVFDRDEYLSQVLPVFATFIKEGWEESRAESKGHQTRKDTYWSGLNPAQFYTKLRVQ